jgi:hypothetical protein
MGNKPRYFILAVILLAIFAVAAVCLHSLEEIHYLKSFFPASFSVREAFFAGALELIKVAIISLPLVLFIAVGLFFLKEKDDR